MSQEEHDRSHLRVAPWNTESGEGRLLRSLPAVSGRAPAAVPEDGRIIALVDCEATSLNPSSAKIIELAAMAVIVDGEGRIVGNTPISSWLEDPGEKLTDEVKLVTKLDDSRLAGQCIDDRVALSILERAQVIVAHNASYDAQLIERRFPAIAGKAWACTVREIDWLRLGYDGAKLGHLVMQAGWYCKSHRAADDVAALFHLLQLRGTIDGDAERTHLERLLDRTDRMTARVSAVRPGYGHSAELKARGYRWNPDRKCWWTDVDETDVDVEIRWLQRSGIRAIDHQLQTACERHRPPSRIVTAKERDDDDPF